MTLGRHALEAVLRVCFVSLLPCLEQLHALANLQEKCLGDRLLILCDLALNAETQRVTLTTTKNALVLVHVPSWLHALGCVHTQGAARARGPA